MARKDTVMSLRQLREAYGKNGDESLSVVEEPKLWGRFQRVQEAVLKLIGGETENRSGGINVMNWTGVDAGIHDVSGTLSGIDSVSGVKLNISIAGTICDNQIRIVADKDGTWRSVSGKESYGIIKGDFESRDGRRGSVVVGIGPKPSDRYEAYYFETLKDGILHLEQIVDGLHKVYKPVEANRRGEVQVPGSYIRLPFDKQVKLRDERGAGT
jgi:hypothetical protein